MYKTNDNKMSFGIRTFLFSTGRLLVSMQTFKDHRKSQSCGEKEARGNKRQAERDPGMEAKIKSICLKVLTQTWSLTLKWLTNGRKYRLFSLLPLEKGCWGWWVLCHQRHLGSYKKGTNLLLFFSRFLTYLSSDGSAFSLRLLSYTFLFFIYTLYPRAWKGSSHSLSSHTRAGNMLPECQHVKEEIRIRHSPVLQKHDPAALSKGSQRSPSVLCLGDVLSRPEEPVVAGECYLVIESGDRTRKMGSPKPPRVRSLPGRHHQTSSLHLLCRGYSTFTFPYPVFHFHLLD